MFGDFMYRVFDFVDVAVRVTHAVVAVARLFIEKQYLRMKQAFHNMQDNWTAAAPKRQTKQTETV